MNPVLDGEPATLDGEPLELSSVDRFPAMRMLRDTARAADHSKKRIKRLHQQLYQEQTNRFDHLVHAEWKGRIFGQYEHLQGRINHLCYHFIFAMEHGQPSEDVSGFLVVYESSTQERSELVALASFPLEKINKYGVLIRLTYMVGYVRNALQTEQTIGLMEKMGYNERVDQVFDQLETRLRAQEHTLNIAMDMSVEMYRLISEIRTKFPETERSFGEQARGRAAERRSQPPLSHATAALRRCR